MKRSTNHDGNSNKIIQRCPSVIELYTVELFNECLKVGKLLDGITRRERPKSAPNLVLNNTQGTTIGNIWKNIFFSKKVFLQLVYSVTSMKVSVHERFFFRKP